jgi:hypothetical protein
MKSTDFFLKIDMIGSFLFALLWAFYPKQLLEYNFDLKTYDDIHLHFSRVLGVSLLCNGLITKYAINKNCPVAKSKIISIKLIGYVLLLLTMIIDNVQSKIMSDKHISFGILGVLFLIINQYLALRSLKKYIRKNLPKQQK